MSNRPIPSNQGMALRLAAAADEQPGASTDAGIAAAGLFAIAASIDRIPPLIEAEIVEEKRGREAAGAKPATGAAGS
jgi:hypothetical protein